MSRVIGRPVNCKGYTMRRRKTIRFDFPTERAAERFYDIWKGTYVDDNQRYVLEVIPFI